MTASRCPVAGCEHVGGIWQGWQTGHKHGVWVCADHYPLSPAELAAALKERGGE